ncbi:ArsR/SmtB family transcription factor [Kineococcus aurantiacus]|uniref:ArsR family transcriptional regulator n=1 Tax=Kineococcus aurantiacus TaxID=37633 RepID=A0A7Y9ATI8_9ACTN|nr:metalloregulator ArsR/SmtB family transcription factor [Kineococcus aurantiacus]NYD21782.1 ArsR family transcriptional regulator [Kineococcus aurantiacus]
MTTALPLTERTAPGTTGCCAPVTGVPLSLQEAERLAAALKAVAEPTRLRLLSLVAAHEGQEACVCDLTEPVGLSQPTVSHHLKVLVDAGLLEREKRGVWAYYRLVRGRLEDLARALAPTP